MPCSQMMSMNCRPPRAIELSRLAMFPAANARIRNRPIRNIGSAIFVSSTQNPASSAIPAAMPPSTNGLVHPVGWPP